MMDVVGPTMMLNMQTQQYAGVPAACMELLCAFAENHPAISSRPGLDMMYFS